MPRPDTQVLLVTLWPSVGDSPPDFGIEGGGGSVSALLGMGQLFSWAPRGFLLGAVQEERKRLLSVPTGQCSVSHYGQGMGFSLQQDEGKKKLLLPYPSHGPGKHLAFCQGDIT